MTKRESYHCKILEEIHEENEKILKVPFVKYALKKTAVDMYKGKHYIRELIQNADDEGSKKIVIEIDTIKRIIKVKNWGKPFDEKDVRQICTLLPSDKRATQIGTLGIGFKSVFSISECPKIFSGGFNFEITKYILPREIEPINSVENQTALVTFVIPIKNEISIESILDELDRLNSEMILFLNNIREIHVKYTNDKRNFFTIVKNIVTKRKFRRLNIEYTTITSTKGSNNSNETQWFVFKRKYKVPENLKSDIRKALKEEMNEIYEDAEEFFRPGEIDRKIERKVLKFITPSIAISSTKDWNLNKMTESKLFISLPTETMTGLKFHINAEFKPSPDRSGIEKTKTTRPSINNWIISKTTDAICEMIEFMKNTKKYQRQFYTILPDLKDTARINDKEIIYNPIHSDIKEYSIAHNVVLTSNNKWAKKDEVCFAVHEEIRNILSKKDLERNFGKKYFVSDRLAHGSKAFLYSIDVPIITFKDFIDFLFNKDNLADKSPSWFLDVYTYLGKYLDEEKHQDIIEMMRGSKIILVTTGELLSPSFEKIFRPPPKGLDESYNLFKNDAAFVHKEIIIRLSKKSHDKNKYVDHFFDLMSVKEYTPYQLIEDIILPKNESDDWKKEGTQRLFDYIDYIRRNINEYEKDAKKYGENKDDPLQRLKKSLWIRINRTENGTNYYNKASNLYFSSAYTGEKQLETLFEGVFKKEMFVHDMYLKKSKKKDKNSWIEFFKKLSVEDKTRLHVFEGWDNHRFGNKPWRVDGSKRAYYTHMPEKVEDYLKCEDLEQLFQKFDTLDNFETKKTKSKALLDILDKKWKAFEEQYKVSGYPQRRWYQSLYKYKPAGSGYYSCPKEIPSGFQDLLREEAWLPVKDYFENSERFEKPPNVYINKPDLIRLVGQQMDFISLEIKNGDLIRLLGIREKPLIIHMIDNLITIAKTVHEENSLKFILKQINNPKNLANVIKKIGEQEEISEGLILLANITYEKFNIKILEAERNDEPLFEEDWWADFKDKVRILTKNNGFCQPSTVFIPPPPHIKTIIERSKIENIPLLPNNWREYETFAKLVDVESLEYGSNLEYKLIDPEETNLINNRNGFSEFESKLKEMIPIINGVEVKKVVTEGDRWDYNDIFGNIKVYCVPRLRVQYNFKDRNGKVYEGNPIPTSVYLRQSPNCIELYIRTNAKNNKEILELIANELSMLTNPEIERDYMAKTIKECLLGYPPMDIEKIESMSQNEGPVPEPTPPETPPPETQPPETQPPETPPRRPVTVIGERQIRDSRPANWVKASYDFHCQICLSRERPKVLTYGKSYAGRKANRKSIIEAHHIKEVAKDKGHDHPGNYLSLCHHHHVLLHELELSLDDVKNSLRDTGDIKIIWPNDKVTQWRILRLGDKFIEGNQMIQIVINHQHLEKLKEYINIIYTHSNSKRTI